MESLQTINNLDVPIITDVIQPYYNEKNKDYYGIVYCSLNKENGKVYIGQTKYLLEERKRTHLNDCKKNFKSHFHYGLKKDSNRFIWEIIDVANTFEELQEKEIYWIKYFQSNNPIYGYNLTEGGDGNSGYKFSVESNKKRGDSVKNFNRKKFYEDYPVFDMMYYMWNNNITFSDCAKLFGLHFKKLLYFFRNEFPEITENFLKRSEKIRHEKTGLGLKKRPIKYRIKVSINKVIELLNKDYSFPMIEKELNINKGVIQKRLKRYDPILYAKVVKKIIRKRNINNGKSINNKRGKSIFKYNISNDLLNTMYLEKCNGVSCEKLSKKYNFPHYTIYKRLKGYKVNE